VRPRREARVPLQRVLLARVRRRARLVLADGLDGGVPGEPGVPPRLHRPAEPGPRRAQVVRRRRARVLADLRKAQRLRREGDPLRPVLARRRRPRLVPRRHRLAGGERRPDAGHRLVAGRAPRARRARLLRALHGAADRDPRHLLLGPRAQHRKAPDPAARRGGPLVLHPGRPAGHAVIAPRAMPHRSRKLALAALLALAAPQARAQLGIDLTPDEKKAEEKKAEERKPDEKKAEPKRKPERRPQAPTTLPELDIGGAKKGEAARRLADARKVFDGRDFETAALAYDAILREHALAEGHDEARLGEAKSLER